MITLNTVQNSRTADSVAQRIVAYVTALAAGGLVLIYAATSWHKNSHALASFVILSAFILITSFALIWHLGRHDRRSNHAAEE
jgi:cell division protein FtsW (lipid II flippase)